VEAIPEDKLDEILLAASISPTSSPRPEDEGSELEAAAAKAFSGVKKKGHRLIKCPKTGCCKKFYDLSALKFHLSHAHNELRARHEAAEAAKRKKREQEETLRRRKEEERARAEAHKAVGELPQQRPLALSGSSRLSEAANVARVPPSTSGLQQISPSGRVTAVVKPLQQQVGYAGASPFINGAAAPVPVPSARRPASPAYSDISDEETDTSKPLTLVQKNEAGLNLTSPMPRVAAHPTGLSVRPEFKPQSSVAAVRPTTQPSTSNILGHSLGTGLPPGFSIPAPPPPSAASSQQQAAAAAALAASLASGRGIPPELLGVIPSSAPPGVPRPPGAPASAGLPTSDRSLEQLMYQSVVSNYLASSKLLELQLTSLGDPAAAAAAVAQLSAMSRTGLPPASSAAPPSPFGRNPPGPPPPSTARPQPAHQNLPPGFSLAAPPPPSSLAPRPAHPSSFPGECGE